MNETYVLRLEYLTNLNEKVYYNIPRANNELTGTEVKNLMDAVKNTNIVVTPKGNLSVSMGAELVTTITKDVEW